MKKRSFRSTFVSVILVITVAISIVNLAVYGINIKKIRQVEVLKMKTAGERIDDMITISLNNIKGLKQICCTDNYARNILLKNNEKNDIGTKFENQNYMDNALKHIASMDTLILRATIVNKYGNIYCTDTSIPEEYVKTIRNMTKEWMLFEGKEDEYYYGGLQGDNANILTFLYPLHTYGNTPIALLAVDINYKTFQSILENAFYENSGECFILTGEQELFHIGEDLYQKEEKGYIFDKSQKMMKENLIVDTFQSKGKNFYISSRQNMLSGWKIIQVIPEERLFEEVDQKIKWNSIFLLLVKDNGCGIDSEKREELNRILCERTRRISYIDEEEKSIGINNVNTRIKNYYGEKYGVKVNKADKGTEIQLLLGIENLEEENKDK